MTNYDPNNNINPQTPVEPIERAAQEIAQATKTVNASEAQVENTVYTKPTPSLELPTFDPEMPIPTANVDYVHPQQPHQQSQQPQAAPQYTVPGQQPPQYQQPQQNYTTPPQYQPPQYQPPQYQPPQPQQTYQQPQAVLYDYAPQGYQQKSRLAAGLLGILLGVFGVHNFYLGFNTRATVQLIVAIAGGALTCGVATIGIAIWGLVEGILILCGTPNRQYDGNGVILSD